MLPMNWSVVTVVCCGICEIKWPFTAKVMTLEGHTRTKESCLMNEGLALACFHDNNHQVQCQLHVCKVKYCDFRLSIFKMLPLTGSGTHFLPDFCSARFAEKTVQVLLSLQPPSYVPVDRCPNLCSIGILLFL